MTPHLKSIVLPKKSKSVLTKITTVIMTALAGIQALSGSILLAANILGLALGAFTLTTCSPVILTAFVASHMWRVLCLSFPIALCQCVVSYILRVCSTSELLDPATKEHDAVKKKHGDYVKSQHGTQQKLKNLYDTKQDHEKMRKVYSYSKDYAEERPYLASIRIRKSCAQLKEKLNRNGTPRLIC